MFPMSPKQKQFFGISAVLATALIAAAALYVHRLMTNGDNLDYLFISWLVRSRDVLEPFKWRFPVGYPYLLSAWLWITGQPAGGEFFTLSTAAVASAKMLGMLLVVPTYAAILFWLRQVQAPFPFLLGMLLATSQILAVQFSIIGSEPPFLFFSMSALALWERLVRQERPSWKGWAAVFACTSVAMQLRQIGMAIPAAVWVYLLFCRNRQAAAWRRAAWGTAGASLLLGVSIMVFTNMSHLASLARGGAANNAHPSHLGILIDGLSTYRMAFPALVVPKCFGGSGILNMLGVSLLEPVLAFGLYAVLVLGLILVFRSPRSEGRISVIYCFVSVAILLVWPSRDYRFWVPMLPILLWVTVVGLVRIGSAVFSRSAQSLAACMVAWILFQAATDAFAARKNLQLIWRMRQLPPWQPERYVPTSELDFAGVLDAGKWIGAHSPTNSKIVSSKALFLQVSARRIAMYPNLLRQAMESADENGTPLYLVWDAFPGASYGSLKVKYMQPVMEAIPERFALEYESPYLQTKVYRYVARLRP